MRRAGVFIVVMLVIGCGGNSQKAATTTTTTTAPSTTTTTAPTTTTDPKVADLAAIKAMWRAQNQAWKTSVDDGLRVANDNAWPPGAWTPDMWYCPAPGRTFDQQVASDRSIRRTNEAVVDDATLELDPAFKVPSGAGAGLPLDGRVYIMHITFTDSGTPGGSTVGEGHVIVAPDGKAYWFPVPC